MSGARCREYRLNIPGGTVFAKQWAPENLKYKVPVVMLHDSLGSADLWRDFPVRLAERLSRTVYAYDRLGFGKSSARNGVPSARFVSEEGEIYFPHIKEALALDRYLLFGHSVGGAMCVVIAANDTDCAAVVTEAAQAFVEDRTVAHIDYTQKALRNPAKFKKMVKWHGANALWVLRAWAEVWLSPEFAAWSLDQDIGKVRCPVLAIHGDRDEYGSVAFPEFISGKTGGMSEMAILQDCGHIPHRERTQEVMDRVASFLDRHDIG